MGILFHVVADVADVEVFCVIGIMNEVLAITIIIVVVYVFIVDAVVNVIVLDVIVAGSVES